MKGSSRKYEGVALRLLSFAGHSYEAALKTFAKEFEVETGASVEIVSLPDYRGWWYLEPIAQADATSANPEFDMFCDDREFQFLLLPHLLPLSPLIEKFSYDMKGFLLPVYKYDEGVAGQPGVRYGLPIRIRQPFIFYRTDLIEEFPSTWDDYDRMLAEHTGGGMYGLGVEGAVYPYHPFGLVHDLNKTFQARYWSLGGSFLTPDWKPLINSDKGVEALEMLKRQIEQYAPPDALTWDATRAAKAFLGGEVAVIESVGVEILPHIQDPARSKVVDKWSVGMYPGTGAAPYTLHNMLIFKHSKNPEAAFEFAAYCTGMESARRLQLDYGEHSPRKTVLTSPEAVAKDPTLPKRAEALERAKPTMPGVPQCYEMLFATWEAVQLCVLGYLSAKDALDRAARKWEKLLAQGPPDWEYHE
jgi:ABC-type glycerol-3-phosphate transport system substrate-binding protein